MQLQHYEIIPSLKPYVKLICTMDCSQDVDTNHVCVLPDACVELFVNYTNTPIAIIGNQLHQQSIITSRLSCPTNVQMRKGAGCIAICFYPGMAYKFFALPMHVLANSIVALADIWNGMATEIEDRLANAHHNNARVAILQTYLLQKLAQEKQDTAINYCLKQVQLSQGLIPVSYLSNATGFSQRQLSRKFLQCVGLSPKAYLQVSKFIQSLVYLKKYPTLSLTEIAYESGYYDQSHFNRHYQTYTGYTPGEVAKAKHILY
ncbi:helix-turn-helix domain-containing protein [Pedobacter sp. Hv1]|uniref:AraC family transcriptional regulator n=1 Tax=Pedobacter sp. Hv1 TaxID=1740090 RepID=UPI0006D8CF7D|nr:helix-turn-helix domain-containing protein [Pedobacter sp. Hv1]KQC01346.1 AraC family transcriptional regulator [Pedobacter sp. Hv1]